MEHAQNFDQFEQKLNEFIVARLHRRRKGWQGKFVKVFHCQTFVLCSIGYYGNYGVSLVTMAYQLVTMVYH